MPTFELSGPDGGTYQIDAPDEHAAVAAFSKFNAAPAPAPAAAPVSVNDIARSAATGVPIIGGVLNKLNAATNAALAPALNRFFKPEDQLPEPNFSDRMAHSMRDQAGADKKFADEHPIVDTAAKLTGGVASMVPVMAAAPVAFGLTGPMSTMVRSGAISGGAISGADAAVRGENVVSSAGIGGIIGGAAGPVGKGVGKVVASIADRVRPPAVVQQNLARVGDVQIPLSQSQLTQDAAASAEEQILLRGGRGDAAQRVGQGFKDGQDAAVMRARDDIGSGLDPSGAVATTSPQDAAERVASELIAQETARSTAAARAAVDVKSSGERFSHSLDPGGQMRGATPGDAAESLSDGLARARDVAKTDYRAKYDATAAAPGEFAPGSASGFRGDVEARIQAGDNPVSLDPTNTSKSLQALDIIDKRLNLAGPAAKSADAPAAGLGSQHAQDVADIRARFGDDVAAAYERQKIAAPVERVATPAAGGGALDPHSVSVAGGGSVDVVPKVVEASSLKTSADAGYDVSLQPRDRSRAASAGQVNDISKNLNPERLGRSSEADRGAPITGADGMVESGNGRIQAIRQAYKENGQSAAKYREWLQAQGADVSKFREPVLIRERATRMTPQERQAFTVGANQGATLTMSAPERALSDAKLISGESLASIKNPADLASVENREFARQFAAKLPQTEQGAFVNGAGQLSAEGATRVRNAVLAKAYGDSPVLTRIAESTHDDIKSVSNALTHSAPEWAAVRDGIAAGNIPKEMDITADLLDAVARTARIRSRGAGLSETMAQTDAFNKQSPISEQLMRLFYDADGRRAASSAQIANGLRFYAQQAAKVEASPGLMMGLETIKPSDILDLAALKIAAPKAISADVLATASKAAAAGEKVAAAAQEPGSGFTMRDVDQVRKQITTLYGDAKKAVMAGGSGSDVRALENILDHFDDRVSLMIAEGKFSGDGPAVDAMQKAARASFSDYRNKFTRRGAGDEVGAAVEKILGRYSDTKATPDAIVRLAYGSTSAPGGQMPVQIAQRIEKIFGKDSSESATYKQGLFAHLTEGNDVTKAAGRIDEFLNGTKGKMLAHVVFSPGERVSLMKYADKLRGIAPKENEPGAIGAAVRRITGADGAPPASANEVVSYLYGPGGKGAGRVSVPLAAHLKESLSPEGWSAVRQGMWEKLTNAGEGKIPFEAQALSQRLHEFLNESGSRLAAVLFSPKELGLMKQLASVYKQMIPVKGTTNPSGTAPMLTKIASGARNTLLPLLGFSQGGVPGAAVALGLDKGLTAMGNAKAARSATKLFYGEQASRSADPRFAKGLGLLGQSAAPQINQRASR